MEPLPLERAVMEFLLRGDHPVLKTLEAQWRLASIRDREFTGVGLFANIDVSHSAKSLSNARRFTFGDVLVDFHGLKAPVGSVLFIEDGKLSTLELYTHGEPWPADDSRFTLRYQQEPRSLISLDGIEP
jgi:hypothetical protein